ncbi:spermidine resistance protein [Coemansia guatemalensis]|uniref:Spermidine resistance protein n=1 Tax=Coemansia guatemalensis TaxID=2761395 RepID=A0A9W8I1N8_9FUNG|nr:spermidine resistance protein [Coemansia guatemalensis]
MTQAASLLTAGGAEPAVGTTGNTNSKQSKAETNQNLCTPTCSSNGTYSEGYTGAFEGPEKLLEIWFAADSEAAHFIGQEAELCSEDCRDQWSELRSGLRCVPRSVWRDMLDLVHCQVLSTLCNEHVDSYLLSESSFFVYPHKLVLKTCGTTTLLYAIPRILEIGRECLGVDGTYQLFYSRKNFMFPDQQESLHQSWEKEVAYLDALFPEGAAYMIGKTNRDHWHVYLSGLHEPKSQSPAVAAEALAAAPCSTSGPSDASEEYSSDEPMSAGQQCVSISTDATVNNSLAGSPTAHPVFSRSSSRSTINNIPLRTDPPGTKADITVEILMTGLDPERMRAMYLGGVSSVEGSEGGKAVEKTTGISAIYPDSISDSYLFTPCGFSLNGLQGDGYYTIHVTPEPHCSYASFETNVSDDRATDLSDPKAIKRLVEQVTRVFGPRFATVTVFKARSDSSSRQLLDGHALAAAVQSAAAASTKEDLLLKTAMQLAGDAAPPSFAPVDGYRSVDRVLYEFDHYWLRYASYVSTN